MHQSMCRVQRGPFVYYTCRRLRVRHAFTTKYGGVSTGACESLNLGFGRGDAPENVRENYRRLAAELGVDAERLTLTKQVHEAGVTVVTEAQVGMGLHQPMTWQTDAIVTALPDTPLVGFYADCVVTLLYDPATHTAGVCHAGWRGMAAGILPKTVETMAQQLGTRRDSLIAVLGPSIRQDHFETDADVPTAMEQQLGAAVRPFIAQRGDKFHVDLQGIGVQLLRQAGLSPENTIDSGLCTMCHSDEFWSHRATHGVRGVQGGVICL
ncbi:MAG: peptidoglycan editing factor PgeF [Eubacteriales bacterium]|nr:peptidoglycan editing factor PgeF [Eubacteriales bacterium]